MKGRPRASRAPLLVFCALAALYLLTANGRLVNRDGEAVFQVARSLVEEGSFAVPAASVFSESTGPAAVAGDSLSYVTETAQYGTDGLLYAKYGLGQSLASLPLYLAGRALAGLSPALGPYLLTRFAVALLNPLVSALTGALLYATLRRLGFGGRPALLATLVWGLSTMAWPYARSYASEPLTGLLLLAAFYGLARGQTPSPPPSPCARERQLALTATLSPFWLAFAGTALGLAALTRLAALVAAPAFVLYVSLGAWHLRRQPARATGLLLSFGAPLLALLSVCLWYNQTRFGSALSTGYQTGGWNTPLAVGLFGLLLSPGKGLLWYNPALLLAIAGARVFLRRCQREAVFVVALSLLWVGFHAPYQFWEGGWSWGPRFLVPLLPFLALPVAGAPRAIARLAAQRSETAARLWRLAIPLAFASGLIVQVPAVGADYTRYLWSTHVAHPDDSYARLIYRPATSPLVGQWLALAEVVGNMATPGTVARLRQDHTAQLRALRLGDQPEAERSVAILDLTAVVGLNVPDFWYVLLYLLGVPFAPLAATVLALVLGLFASLWLLDGAVRREVCPCG